MLLLKMFKIQGFLSVNLLGQVVTSLGQILVHSTGDNTLRVLCCALFVVCVVGVKCVGGGVCWCWCWCWCWCVTLISTSTLSTPLFSPSVPPVCTFETSPCVPAPRPQVLPLAGKCDTCGRRAGAHGDVLKHWGFQRATPHHTARTHHDHKNTHKRQQQPPQHTETGTERDRERRKRKCREDERLEKRRSRDKKREDERREKTREEKMKDKRRWREKRREGRWKIRWKRSRENEERQRWNEMKEKMIL